MRADRGDRSAGRRVRPSPGWIAIALVFAAAVGASEPQLEGEELVAALRGGGLVILMRHMSTDSVVPDDDEHVDADCATQRNLSEQGRAEGKAVGEAIAELGVPIGEVWSSPYCRCVETGMLAFGRVVQRDDLAVFDDLSGSKKDERGKLIRRMLNTPPEGHTNSVLITHSGSLLYTFGLQTTPEGIAHVFRPAEFGQAIYLGRITPEQWIQLAGNAPPAS